MEIPENVKIIDWPTSTMWFDECGILCSISKNYTPVSVEENQHWYDAWYKLANGKKLCIMVDISEASQIHPASVEFISRNLPDLVKAQAMISDSIKTRFVSNLVLGFKPPKFPMRMFTREADARQWLIKYI
jgi:hypothetical protein